MIKTLAMKAFFLLIAVIFLEIAGYSQTIQVKHLKDNSSVVTREEVMFEDEKIMLENSTIKCVKISLTKEVKKIKVTGSMIIHCEDFTLEADPAMIEFSGADGNLAIYYTGIFTDHGRAFRISKDSGIKFIVVNE
jgi:hypothetical protein